MNKVLIPNSGVNYFSSSRDLQVMASASAITVLPNLTATQTHTQIILAKATTILIHDLKVAATKMV